MAKYLQSAWFVLAAATLVFSQSGCVTGNVWSSAASPEVREQQVDGVLFGADGKPEAAVISYDAGFQNPQILRAVVPLRPESAAPRPFRYGGQATTPEKIAADLSAEQKAAIFSATAPIDWKLGGEADAILSSPQFHRFEKCDRAQTKSSEPLPVQVREGSVSIKASPGGDEKRLITLAIVYNQPRLDAGSYWPESEEGPENAQILVLPLMAPRPERAIAPARFRAALLTPLTVPFDAAATVLSIAALPILILVFISYGGGC